MIDMTSRLVADLSPSMIDAINSRIVETEDVIKGVQDKNTRTYLDVLMGLKFDYEQVGEYDKADNVAKECLDILYGNNIKGLRSEETISEMILSCYDTRARCGDYESFCIAMEWNRPIQKQFYLPRAKLLKKHGVIDGIQDLIDDKLDLLVLNLPPRIGKELSDDTPILTRKGWKNHGDLVVGDEVLNHKGEFVKVLGCSEKCLSEYVVTMSNGEQIECHGNHEWLVYDRYLREETIRETNYMINKLTSSDNKRYRFLLPEKQCIYGEYVVLPVDPYTFGVWLGDGTNTNPYITGDKNDYSIIKTINDNGYNTKHVWINNKTGVYTYDMECLRKDLQSLGLCYSRHRVPKYIPAQYLTASLNQRLELLAGLLDTDGTLRKKEHRYSFTTSEEILRDDFISLVNTFGWRTCVVEYEPSVSSSGIKGKHKYWVISFNPTFEIPCKLKRKQLKEFSKPRRISIKSIEPIKEKKWGKCIQVEGGIYLAGKTLIPTHNSTVALFLLCQLGGMFPDESILGAGHTTGLIDSFYDEIFNFLEDTEYRYKEIFPLVHIVDKSSEYHFIDLQKPKRFHTYNFISIETGGTGKVQAERLLYCDDLVKDVEQANNPDRLEKLYHNYTSTIKDRKIQRECKDGEFRPCPELHINTPWSIHDVTSRVIMNAEQGDMSRVRIISIPCYDENGESNFMYDYGKGFNAQYYRDMEIAEDPVIFSAKYLMKPIEREGIVFTKDTINFYNELPSEEPDRIVSYIDVSHGGEDYFSMPVAYVYGNEVYIEKVLFKHHFGGDDYIRPFVRDLIINQNVSRCGIEKNNGGDFFSTLVEQDLKSKGYRCNITTHNAPTNKSKLDRILACQNEIKGIATENNTYRLYFKNPELIKGDKDYMEAMHTLYSWNQNPKMQNKQKDDFPDSLAGLITNILGGSTGGKAHTIDASKYLY